jgi:hypothetical protein
MLIKYSFITLTFVIAVSSHASAIGRALRGEKPPQPKTGEVSGPADGEADLGAVKPAQQPIERSPGFSESPIILGVDAKGNFGITSIDRNHPTVKAWIDEKVISEDQIKRIQGGEAVDVELPDVHQE